MDNKAQEIFDFWFGDTDGYREEWFKKDPAFDEAIRERFGEDLELAIQGEYDHWADEPKGRIALIILLDQFSRNLFRGSPKSWSQDPKSLKLTLEGIALRHDLELSEAQRFFFYLPLEHSEELEMQNLAVAKYTELADDFPDSDGLAKNGLSYAKRHQVVVERFGRFPHRNEVLGRKSTPEEIEFLNGPNAPF